MRNPTDFVALRDIKQPGTFVFGYRAGDDVHADVVNDPDWGIVVGQDVRPTNTGAVARPADDAPRADWQAYAIGQGMKPADAEAASLDDLVSAYPAPDPENPPPAEALPEADARPADSAKKADWISYVVANGGDEEWANAGDTTKADLQGWTAEDSLSAPNEGDPVAESATQQANG